MPANLLAIVAVQLAVLLSLRVVLPRHGVRPPAHPLIALALGTVFGLGMDIIVGSYGVFGYRLEPATAVAVLPLRLPMAVLLLNALASYGTAAVTIASVAPRLVRPPVRKHGVTAALAFAVLAGAAAVRLIAPGSIAMMFAWGVSLVGAGELALHVRGDAGPVLTLLARHEPGPLLELWALSAVIGTVYELANVAFPFWAWLPDSTLDARAVAALVALLGYVALLHPLAVLYLLGTPRKDASP